MRRVPGSRARHQFAWVTGIEHGRGPDNEPLIGDCRVLRQVDIKVIDEVQRRAEQLGDDWGTLDRSLGHS